jgi:hypothetical protein
MEQRWNDTDREKLKDLEKNLSRCLFAHKSQIEDYPRSESGPPR